MVDRRPDHSHEPGSSSNNGGGVIFRPAPSKRNQLQLDFQSQPGSRKSVHGPVPAAPRTWPAIEQPSPPQDADQPYMRIPHSISQGRLKFSPEVIFENFTAEDLVDRGEIGQGAFGAVNLMIHKQSKQVMAVKRIRSTMDKHDEKQLLRDLDVIMRSEECPFIVQFFGAIFNEGDCWICMELMDTSLEKLYKAVFEKLHENIPESIIGKVALATVNALSYLHLKLKIIHRDVKPSNILLDRRGHIKLCDFGIAGQLVDSIAKTRDAGCRPYMAPERIDPKKNNKYDVRADVWSLGITLVEVATGKFPYPEWNSVFDQLQQVVDGDPPLLNPDDTRFTLPFVNFVNLCLIKDESLRPKYSKLMEHPFIKKYEHAPVPVAQFVIDVVRRAGLSTYHDLLKQNGDEYCADVEMATP